MIIFNLFIFITILFTFGWVFSRYFLKENKIFILFPLAILIGGSAYVFLLNNISYFIPIQFSFWIVLLVLALTTLFFSIFYRNKKKECLILGISLRWVWVIAFIFLLISASSLIIGLRSLEYDTLVSVHIPTASTIAEGNFPVRDVQNPSNLMKYHYAPELFSAAIYKTTGLPIDFAYDFQIGIGAGLIFLLSFVLAYFLIKKTFPAFLASLFMLFGSGVNFLNIFRGLPVLYNKFILGENIEAPFKFVNHVIYGELVNSATVWIQGHSMAIGLPVTLGVIYFYLQAIKSKNKYWIRLMLVSGLLFGYLALSTETFFAILAAVFIFYPLWLLIFSNQKINIKRIFIISFLILGIGILIASYQGGVLTQAKHLDEGSQSFILSLRSIENVFKSTQLFSFSFLTWFFLREFGLPLLLLIPALIYFRKNKQIFVFLGSIAIIPFFIPFIITYTTSGCIEYFFHLSIVFLSLISGLYLGSLILKAKLQKRKFFITFLSVISFIIILNGLIFQIMFMIYPFGNLSREPHPFLAKLPPMSDSEKETHLWIKEHTTIQDVFFLTKEEDAFFDLEYPLGKSFFTLNFDFIINYGRFALTFPFSPHQSDPSIDEILKFKKIKEECDGHSMKEFNIKYIYFTPQWPSGLIEQCLENNNLDLVFQSGESKIYYLK